MTPVLVRSNPNFDHFRLGFLLTVYSLVVDILKHTADSVLPVLLPVGSCHLAVREAWQSDRQHRLHDIDRYIAWLKQIDYIESEPLDIILPVAPPDWTDSMEIRAQAQRSPTPVVLPVLGTTWPFVYGVAASKFWLISTRWL
jgi:hypothetical protein